MSETKIHELHRKLSEKLIEEAHVVKEKTNIVKSVKLNDEIIKIKREINEELDKLKGKSKTKIDYTE